MCGTRSIGGTGLRRLSLTRRCAGLCRGSASVRNNIAWEGIDRYATVLGILARILIEGSLGIRVEVLGRAYTRHRFLRCASGYSALCGRRGSLRLSRCCFFRLCIFLCGGALCCLCVLRRLGVLGFLNGGCLLGFGTCCRTLCRLLFAQSHLLCSLGSGSLLNFGAFSRQFRTVLLSLCGKLRKFLGGHLGLRALNTADAPLIDHSRRAPSVMVSHHGGLGIPGGMEPALTRIRINGERMIVNIFALQSLRNYAPYTFVRGRIQGQFGAVDQAPCPHRPRRQG